MPTAAEQQCIGELAKYASHEAYNADLRIRSTQLKEIMSPQGPAAYYLKYVNPVPDVDREFDKWDHVQPKVNDMVLGTLIHEFALEGKQNWFMTKQRRGSKGWLDDLDEHDHKWALTPVNDSKLRAWREAMMRNQEIRRIVESGSFAEQAFRFHHWTGIAAKARVDLFAYDGTIWDLKSTRENTRDGFERQLRNLNYPFSAAFYEIARNSVPELHGVRAPFKHIVLCKNHPYYCYVWPLDQSYLREGHKQVHQAFQKLKRCMDLEASGTDPLEAWPDEQERLQGDTMGAPDWWLSERGWTPEEF